MRSKSKVQSPKWKVRYTSFRAKRSNPIFHHKFRDGFVTSLLAKIGLMHKQTIIVLPSLILILLITSFAFSQDLREMQYEEVPTAIIPDVDFEYQKLGLLIVESPIQGLKFKSTNPLRKGWIYQKKDEPGIWYVKVSAGTNLIDISADGFLPLLNIRKVFRAREAWKIRVTSKTDKVNELPVMIRVEPSGAEVKIDGKPADISGSLKLSISEHSIEIVKSGYVTIRDKFTVSQDNIFFEYTLEKPKLCVVEVTTDPSGAEVSIDGVKLNGTTPVSDFYNSGRYPLRITRDKYLPVEESVFIDQSKAKNTFSYRLESNTGTIIISCEPEVNLDVVLNGKSAGKTPLTLREQDVGDYTVLGSHEYYTAESINFTLQRSATYRAIMKAEENFAILTVNTTPGATVYLNNQKLTSLQNLRLTPQTARLRAEKPKCKTVETSLILKRGARESVDLYLDEQTGTIAISVDPPNASIELNGDAGEHYTSTGTKIFENIPVGSYELEVSLKGYKTDKRTLRLRADETLRERVTLEEGGGGEGPLPGMVFVDIPGGSFMMGSPSNESNRESDENQHRVTLSGYQMMTTEVTQGMWKAIMGNNPSNWKGDNLPVEQVSWNDCQEFIKKLNQRDPGKNYRLPTESEWEYACRAGTTTRFYSGDRDSDLDRVGLYDGNSGRKTHPVGQKQPNAWGLYDMHGNVWEWCQDRYGNYPSGSVTDPPGPSSGSNRVGRGGGWYYDAGYCRSAFRSFDDPSSRYSALGFRLARSHD